MDKIQEFAHKLKMYGVSDPAVAADLALEIYTAGMRDAPPKIIERHSHSHSESLLKETRNPLRPRAAG